MTFWAAMRYIIKHNQSTMKRISTTLLAAFFAIAICSGQNSTKMVNQQPGKRNTGKQSWTEGQDYTLFQRVRIMDQTGFNTPVEAYSLLIPKGWKSEGSIIWNGPGSNCAGTYRQMRASSAEGKYTFALLPDMVFSWNSDPQMQQFGKSHGSGNFCGFAPPMNAETYLRNVFIRELGASKIVSIETNASVVEFMRQSNQRNLSELQVYGGGQMSFDQTAVNAVVKWNDGSEGLITLGVSILASAIPNAYTGGYSQLYTSQVTQRTVFKYPAAEADQAKRMYTMILSSVRTNPGWNDAVNNFWKQARQQSHIAHLGRIKAIDEQTRRIGEQAIRNGQQRLASMDTEIRTWEQRQSSQDRMHTEFIKTIREVENFRDETGKWEMSAHYNHAWSRGDGTNFIMSNDPNFNPASVFQDQNWKQMKKVH